MPRVGGAQGQRPDRARREAGIDPICHTLVGAGLARSGLGRRTTFGGATLLIGANLPDIDALAYFGGPAADLAFRRGWTHGVLALALLPPLLAGAMLLLDRIIRRITRPALPSGISPRELLLLATVAILTHPVLDTLNTYGVRWLMPFDGRWLYGDVLFIVDPWLWLALGAGVLASRRRRRPARLALGFLVAYASAMAAGGMAARRIAARELVERTGAPIEAMMLSPLPVTPLARRIVATQGDRYLVGRFEWLGRPRVDPASIRTFPRGRPEHPAVAVATATKVGRRYLSWARFPTYRVEPIADSRYVVHIVDLRYAERPGVRFGSVSLPVTLPTVSGPAPDNSPASPLGAPGARAR